MAISNEFYYKDKNGDYHLCKNMKTEETKEMCNHEWKQIIDNMGVECIHCGAKDYPSTPNKNIECWEEDFRKLVGKLDFNRVEAFESIQDFIRQTLSAQRSNLVKEIEGLRFNRTNDLEKLSPVGNFELIKYKRQFRKILDEVINLINSSK